MSYKNRKLGRGRRSPRLDQLTRIERMVAELLRRSGLELEMEFEQMADFSALNARVSKLTDIGASFKTMNDGLKAERDAARAELEKVKSDDAADQAAVDAAEAELAKVTAVLEALSAVASNTDIAPAPVGVGSMGGANPTE